MAAWGAHRWWMFAQRAGCAWMQVCSRCQSSVVEEAAEEGAAGDASHAVAVKGGLWVGEVV